jgi:large subunit ribosomal protein LX
VNQMTKQAFRIEGDFQMGRIRQHFTLDVAAENEEKAREYIFTDLGSRHSVPRRLIDIQSVTGISGDDADLITQKRVAG